MACLVEPGCYQVLQGHWQSGREQQAWFDSAAKDGDSVPWADESGDGTFHHHGLVPSLLGTSYHHW